MKRVLAGIAASLLLITGATLIWRGAAQGSATPSAPAPRLAAAVPSGSGTAAARRLEPIGAAPVADPRTKEEKRFARADKNDDGRISLAELVEPRRKAFARLDLDQNGALGFEEWAVKTIDKFEDADADRNAALTPAEFAATAPKRKARAACSC